MRSKLRFAIIGVCLALILPMIGIGWKLSSFVSVEQQNETLIWAVEKGDQAAVVRLLKQGTTVYARQPPGDRPRSLSQIVSGYEEGGPTAIMVASSRGDRQMVELLLAHGADTEDKDRTGSTPLTLAAARGHDAIVALLLEKGASVETGDGNMHNPLMCAAMNGHAEIARVLLAHGAKVDEQDLRHKTALCLARERGFEPVVQLLQQAGGHP